MIGFFDSGIGGTSIWSEVVKILPYEDTLLIADSKNAPYGTKNKDEVIFLCEKNTEFLLENDSKIIVVACNTATTQAISYLREKYSVPFIGIEPAIKPASLQTKTKVIGILATQGTLNSKLFHQTSQLFAVRNGIKIIEQIGYGLVELIENGQLNSPEMFSLLKKYLTPMIAQNIDYLVLGCTHYPYLIPIIKQILPAHIQIVDSGRAVARQTKKVLEQNQLLTSSVYLAKHLWITTKNRNILSQFAPQNVQIKYLEKIS